MIIKNRFLYIACLSILIIAVLGSCKEKAPKEEGEEMTGYEKNRTERDSSDVVALIDKFFTFVEEEDYAEAAAMLFKDNPSKVHEMPEPLDNKEMAEVKNMLKSIPIIEHRIDYIKFNQTYSNEVKVTAVIAKAEDKRPEIKTVFYFKPYDYLGTWKLCLLDSGKGDKQLVKGNKRDSIARDYHKKVAAKRQNRHTETEK